MRTVRSTSSPSRAAIRLKASATEPDLVVARVGDPVGEVARRRPARRRPRAISTRCWSRRASRTDTQPTAAAAIERRDEEAVARRLEGPEQLLGVDDQRRAATREQLRARRSPSRGSTAGRPTTSKSPAGVRRIGCSTPASGGRAEQLRHRGEPHVQRDRAAAVQRLPHEEPARLAVARRDRADDLRLAEPAGAGARRGRRGTRPSTAARRRPARRPPARARPSSEKKRMP